MVILTKVTTKAGVVTVLEAWTDTDGHNKRKRCRALCFCGKTYEVWLYSLLKRNSNSCGCYKSTSTIARYALKRKVKL